MVTKGKATIIPTMRFHDAPRAIDWLCEAFGFERHESLAHGHAADSRNISSYRGRWREPSRTRNSRWEIR